MYTQAIAGDATDATLRSNRSAAFLAIGDVEATIEARSISTPVPTRPRPRGARRSLLRTFLSGVRFSPPRVPRF
jgi:hypothetical protein